MIIFDRNTKELDIPVGLGNLEVVVEKGGGEGSTVSYEQLLSAGTEIGRITIDGNTTNIYAPEGGGGGGVTPEDVQTMIDSALTDYATTAVTETKLDKPNASIGALSRPIYYNRNSGLTACNTTTLANSRWNGLVGDQGGNTMVGRYLVFHSTPTDNTTTTQFGKNASKGGFTVFYPTTGTDYTLTTNQHFVVDSDDIVHIKKITQAGYDALVSAGTVDEHTLYLIEN